MKKVYTADSIVMSGYIQGLLESCDIQCMIRNQILGGAIGEIPPTECWPEVWILDDDDYDEALSVIHSILLDPAGNKADWQCACGETLEAQFHCCWSCGREKTA